MTQNNVIETEIWEDHPEKPGYLRFVKTRKAYEVFKELESSMKENDMMPDEYFLLSPRFDEKTEIPRDACFYAYAQWGSNEGVYLEVEMVSQNGRQHFATGKTLGETEEDYDRMQAIAGFIYKSFAGFGRAPIPRETSEKEYGVFIYSHYTCDMQVLYSAGLSDEEFEKIDMFSEDGEAYLGSFDGANAYVGRVRATSKENAINAVAQKHGLDPRTMFAAELK